MIKKKPLNKRKAFTLIEVIIAMAIFCVLLVAVYKLFIGGSKTANKGQWINTTVEQTRNTLSFINNEVNSATYPSAVLKDTIYDTSKNATVAKEYYLRVLKDDENIKVPDSGELKIMEWHVCKAEKREENEPGTITDYELYLSFNNKAGSSNTGNLVLKSKYYTFEKYYETKKLSKQPDKNKKDTKKILVEDVEWVKFNVIGNLPPKTTKDNSSLKVTIHTLYPKDTNVFKENSILATPKVAIDLL